MLVSLVTSAKTDTVYPTFRIIIPKDIRIFFGSTIREKRVSLRTAYRSKAVRYSMALRLRFEVVFKLARRYMAEGDSKTKGQIEKAGKTIEKKLSHGLKQFLADSNNIEAAFKHVDKIASKIEENDIPELIQDNDSPSVFAQYREIWLL